MESPEKCVGVDMLLRTGKREIWLRRCTLNLGGVNKSRCSDRFQPRGQVVHGYVHLPAVPCFLPYQRLTNLLVNLTPTLELSYGLMKFSMLS